MTPVDLLFFCDESSQVDDEWCAVAGLAMPRAIAAEATQHLRAMNQKFGRKGEVKWSKAKSFGGGIQREYITYLFDQIGRKRMHFHIRFSPMNEYDHKLSGPRKRLDTVSKSFYQLLKYRAVRHYSMHNIFIIPDDGPCTAELPEQIGALNATSRNNGCVHGITPRSSETEPMLQLLDVTLGALSAMRNNRHKSSSMGVKTELSELAFSLTKWPDLTGNCPKSARTISRWNVRPSLNTKVRGPQT